MSDVLVRQTDRKLDQAAIISLRKRLRGALLQAFDPGYAEARTIWNAMIAKRPALIARVSGSAPDATWEQAGRPPTPSTMSSCWRPSRPASRTETART